MPANTPPPQQPQRNTDPPSQPRNTGNQNAVRHGWYSRKHPPSQSDLTRAIREAVREKDPAALRDLAKFVRYHQRHGHSYQQTTAQLQKLARLIDHASPAQIEDALEDTTRKEPHQ